MQFPESWLREFCDPPLTTQQLADTLTMAGLEVEELQPVAPPFSGVVVGEIKELVQHPNADRLRVCQVDIGQAALLTIVCGAPNARLGIRVPCAVVGAQLPPGEDGQPFAIRVGKLRGVESHGMLCSAKELQIADDHGGLMELPADAPLGQDIRRYLNLDDTRITLKLTPNLAHALSVYGIARELSALTGAPLKTPEIQSVPATIDDTLPVQVQAPDLCGRFSGRVLKGVDPTSATPAWMVDRLARCGQRSVSALVDISNYVMFEYGRPTHIFDLDKIHGGLQVRWGREGEQLQLLNGQTVAVDAQVGVIADDAQVESLAGIMGGDATAVSDDTRNIYIEAAFWWPKAVAGRSRRYNFSTDAGHRFERGVDPSLTAAHLERITQLVIEICGTDRTQVGPVDDQVIHVPIPQAVVLRVERASKVIGMPLTQTQCVAALRALGLPLLEGNGTVTVTPPAYRFDLLLEEDLIEEVARLLGYNNLPTSPPSGPLQPKLRSEQQRSPYAIKRHLAALGYQETINFSFVPEQWERELAGHEQPIRLLNPIASHMNVMRSSLLGSLLQVLKFNVDRKADRVRVFELGRVFMKDASTPESDTTVAGIDQPLRLAALAYGPAETLSWHKKATLVDFFDVKGDLETLLSPLHADYVPAMHPALHPGRCARVRLGDKDIGWIGELHPKWRQSWDLPHAPVLFELDWSLLIQRKLPAVVPVSKHPEVQRDLAILVSENVSHDDLMRAIEQAPVQEKLRQACLFDVYHPPKQSAAPSNAPATKSMAVRLTLGNDDATLTDQEVDAIVHALMSHLTEKLGAQLR